jgi:hypothetical protein
MRGSGDAPQLTLATPTLMSRGVVYDLLKGSPW